MKQSINSVSDNGSKRIHSKMRKTVAPIAAGVAFTLLSCQSPKEKQDDKSVNNSEQLVTPRQYNTYLDVNGNPLTLKTILSVNADLQFYEDSISKELSLYKNRSASNGEYRKELLKGPYLRVENFGDYVKAFKDTTVFDLISKNLGTSVENIEAIDEEVKGYKTIKKGDGYGLYKEEFQNEEGSRQEGKWIISPKYDEITHNYDYGFDEQGSRTDRCFFIGHKDKGYDVFDSAGVLLSSVDRILDHGRFIKYGKLLLFAHDGSKVQLDAYTVFGNGGEGSDGDVAIVYEGKRYHFDFMTNGLDLKDKYKGLREKIAGNEIGDKLKILIASRKLAVSGKGDSNFSFDHSGYEETDARLLKPNKSEKELLQILAKLLPSKANQKRGEFAFEKIDADENCILSYKIVGWSGSERKQVLQSGGDIEDYLLQYTYEHESLNRLTSTIFDPIDESSVIDENGKPVDAQRMYKPDERVYIKFKPVTK